MGDWESAKIYEEIYIYISDHDHARRARSDVKHVKKYLTVDSAAMPLLQ
jgi:hypothetical protein